MTVSREPSTPARDARRAALSRQIMPYLVEGSVLDVGCGGGEVVADLLARGFDAHGVDGSRAAIARAAAHLAARGFDDRRVVVGTLRTMIDAGERHDNVLALLCLEHFAHEERFISGLVRVTRGGGRLVIVVPALMALYGAGDQAAGHQRRYGPRRLRELVVRQPLVVEELRYLDMVGAVAQLVSNTLGLGPAADRSSFGRSVLRGLAGGWMRLVEGRLRLPVGASLLVVARRL